MTLEDIKVKVGKLLSGRTPGNSLPVTSKNFNDLIDFINNAGITTQKKIYKALITQSGTDAPTVTILENTIGNIVWSYDSTGTYFGTLINAFTENKTFLPQPSEKTHNSCVELLYSDADTVEINTYDVTPVLANDILVGNSILIEVYA